MNMGAAILTAFRSLLCQSYHFPMLSKSRLNRRLHALADTMLDLFHQLGMALKANGVSQVNDDWQLYLVDSFPVALCDNIRISRCRLVQNEDVEPEDYRGYIASKKRYFYGLRVHVVTTASTIRQAFI